eukprot:jgi/Tetstr1/427232/TSEL_017419.t1
MGASAPPDPSEAPLAPELDGATGEWLGGQQEAMPLKQVEEGPEWGDNEVPSVAEPELQVQVDPVEFQGYHSGGGETTVSTEAEARAAMAQDTLARWGLFGDVEEQQEQEHGKGDTALNKADPGKICTRRRLVTWILLAFSLAFIVAGVLLQVLPSSPEKTYVFRWCYVIGAIVPFYLISDWIVRKLIKHVEVMVFQQNLSHYETLVPSYRNVLTLALLLLWERCLFIWVWCDGANVDPCENNVHRQGYKILTGATLTVFVLFLISAVAATATKVLSTHFHKTTHFAKLQVMLNKEFLLQKLSKPRRREKNRRDTTTYVYEESVATDAIDDVADLADLQPGFDTNLKLNEIPTAALGSAGDMEDDAALDGRDIERLRAVVVVTTFSQLLEQHDYSSPEELAQQAADVRAFGKALFSNLRGADKSRKYITMSDFRLLFKDDKKGRDRALSSFNLFATDPDAHVTKSQVVDSVLEIFKERSNLAMSLTNTQSMMESLERALLLVLHFLGADALQAFSTFAATLVGLSFVFGNTFKNTFEAVMFLFVQHPYDVGDTIRIDGTVYDVLKIGLLSTYLVADDGHHLTVLNASILGKAIFNLSRTPSHLEFVSIPIDVGVAFELHSMLLTRLRAHVDANKADLDSDTLDCVFTRMESNMKVNLFVLWKYLMAPCDWARKRAVRNGMMRVVHEASSPLENPPTTTGSPSPERFLSWFNMESYLVVQPSTVRIVATAEKLRRLLSTAMLFVAVAVLLASAEGVTEKDALWALRSQQQTAQEAIATWDYSTDPCSGSWQGVTCVGGAVTELALAENQLTGTVPAQFSALPSLTHLRLQTNGLAGTVPVQLSALSRLELMRLDENKLTGAVPRQLSVLASLERVDLDKNRLSGPIPAQLSTLSRLELMYLYSNDLTGTVPAQLSALSSLRQLSLRGNQLTGTVPAHLSLLSSLTDLYLYSNQLTGTVPAQLSAMSRLTDLSLSDNQLTGTVPAQLSLLSSLTDLSLSDNQLTGTVPAQLSSLSSLTDLSLSDNQLTGTVPAQLSSLSSLTDLSLSDNQLTGTVPAQLSSLSSLTDLYLYSNQLTGTVPAQLSAMSSLTDLSLRGNQLMGTVPAQLSSLSSLTDLYLYGNQLTGTVPAQLSALSSLADLRLDDNQLTGTVPAQLSTLSGLTKFNVSNNFLAPGGLVLEVLQFDPQAPAPHRDPSFEIANAAPPSSVPPPVEIMDTPPPNTVSKRFGLPAAAVIGGIGAAVALVVAGTVIAICKCYMRSSKRKALAANYEQDPYPCMGGSISTPVRNLENTLWPDTTAALEAQFPDRNVPLDPEHIGHEVYNLHVTLPDDLSKPPMRLVHIYPVVNHWQTLPVYETMPERDYIEVPYCEASNTYWDVTCMLSWRWANGKSPDIDEAASPMSEQQFSELQRKLKLAADAGMKYVWIDWCCVPQYDGNPMVEIHRSRLYYARARALIVLPGFRALSETPMMVILLTHAQLMLAKSTGEDVASDRLIAQALKRIIDAKACASREYFGRVWTLAERMARHARKEKLCEWLSLDLWLGMVVDAMLGGKNDAAAAIYWQKLFPSEVLEQLSSVEQEISLALEASHASKNLYKAVAELCRSGYQVWASMALQEEATTEWLQTYLLEEAGQVYGAFNKNDIVWSIYCFFCYEQDVTASKALGNLCRIANVNIADLRMYKSIVAAQKELEN